MTPTGYALLGLLSFGRQLSGYELKQWADASLRFFYASPPMSQVYAELDRLRAAGLVTVKTSGARSTKRYRLSAAGRRVLVRWLRDEPPEPPTLKHHLALRVFFGHLVEPEVLIAQLEAHRRWCDELLVELAAVKETLVEDPAWVYPALVADWGETYFTAERTAADRLTAQLASETDDNDKDKETGR